MSDRKLEQLRKSLEAAALDLAKYIIRTGEGQEPEPTPLDFEPGQYVWWNTEARHLCVVEKITEKRVRIGRAGDDKRYYYTPTYVPAEKLEICEDQKKAKKEFRKLHKEALARAAQTRVVYGVHHFMEGETDIVGREPLDDYFPWDSD